MAKVSLRVYNREIEGMIESGQLDEAVAHCQQILKTFPMHVDTYRLLGKSFLEARRYSDAADIFQRALMAVPDDFVANVGMSIIRDDEGRLDEAIWHMERAFEVQPSNSAIQGEIRRLYGRRDGTEPPKIRLSRDALANMYSQGELYNQAIAEIRAVLAEDANRPDLQIMLARAYYHSGQKVEAAEMAANLLKKYTYCMDALRILVDVLPEAARTENTQVYRQRLQMLDPYSSFVTGSVFATDKVADGAVTLERLEYRAGAAPVSQQPNWASSLGIKLTEEKHIEPGPNRVTIGDSVEPLPIAASDSIGPTVTPAVEDQQVPDWMRSAGWKESSSKAQEGPLDSSGQKPAEPVAQADMPDWLKSMAPQQSTEANASTEQAPASLSSQDQGDAPEWLAGLGTASADAFSELPQPAAPSQENIFPEWLREMDNGTSAGTAADLTPDTLDQSQHEDMPVTYQPASSPTAAQESVKPPVSVLHPDEDSSFHPAGESKPLGMEADDMTWLESLATTQGEKEEELRTKPGNRAEEIPDWLRSIDEQPSVSNTQVPASPSLEPLSPMAEELIDNKLTSSEQLTPLQPVYETAQPLNIEEDEVIEQEDFTTEQGENEEEPLTKPEPRIEEMPDWLRPVDRQSSDLVTPEPFPLIGETQPLETITPLAGEVADHITAPSEEMPSLKPTDGTAQPLHFEEDSITWLKDITPEHEAKPEEVGPKPDERSEPLPEWIKNTTQDSVALEEAETTEVGSITPGEDVTFTSWLTKKDVEKALDKTRPATDLPQPVVAPSNELPNWLKDLEKPPKPEESPKPAEEIPDWLRQPVQPPDQGAAAVPVPEITSQPKMPAWIDDTIPVSGPPAPTTPGEWVSVDEKPAPSQDLESIIKPAVFSVDTPVQRQILGGTGMLSRVPAEDKDAEFLAAAQTALDARQLEEAMQAYAKLIKKNRLLDEVIHDLREAIYRFPVDISIWQTLGDAYMRANRLQDALDAYTKAEELLR
jgi:tetratricopeptide (TPR) repeat protein